MKLFMSIMLASLMLVLTGCAEQTVSKDEASPEVQKKVNASTESEVEEEEEVEEVEEKEVVEEKAPSKVGETLNIDGVKITVVSIEPFTGRMNQYEPLKQDHVVRVNVIVENAGTEEVFVDSSEFSMYDTEGFEILSALPGDESPVSGSIPVGKKIQGAAYFDVPAQTGTWELHYSSMASFSGESAIWEVPTK